MPACTHTYPPSPPYTQKHTHLHTHTPLHTPTHTRTRTHVQVRSRTFSETVNGEGITLMVPYADLANHSFSHNSTFCVGQNRQSFELRSVVHIEGGVEAAISYGALCLCTEFIQRRLTYLHTCTRTQAHTHTHTHTHTHAHKHTLQKMWRPQFPLVRCDCALRFH